MKSSRTKTPRKTPGKLKVGNKDPIVVYCRIRPVDKTEQICIKPKDSKTIVLYPPDGGITYKECSFSHVFGEETTQKQLFDHVSLPLIEDLLTLGSNGLIFTYGITSSGKTYTMTGTPNDCGLLPRTLDVIFNSIADYQAEKYVFKPTQNNAFYIQTVAETLFEKQKEVGTPIMPSKSKRRDLNRWGSRESEPAVVQNVMSDMRYSVFVTYVEIYNNYVYDLLGDSIIDGKKNSLTTREDSAKNTYVYGANVNEVRTVDEALELFQTGQFRRKIAETALNTESSRSHSIFTIRVVRAPLDADGINVSQNLEHIAVSQLSLVDLAGSERQGRTRNQGSKLKEAGNINSSLSVLRNCIEALRENQTKGYEVKMVPYRESKLTSLFTTYFKGEGKIRMVVCVNPRADDYKENLHVMNFAEITQEVLIARPTPFSTPSIPGYKVGRGKQYREALQLAKDQGIPVGEYLAPLVYCLPDFPHHLLENDAEFENLITFLVDREASSRRYFQDLERRQAEFRNCLIEVDRENIHLKSKISMLEQDLDARQSQISILEGKLGMFEKQLTDDDNKIRVLEKRLIESQNEIDEKTDIIMQQNYELQRKETDTKKALAREKDKMCRIMEARLAEKQADLERKLRFTGEQFRLLTEILRADDWDNLMDVNVPNVPVGSTNPSELTVPQTRSKRRSSYSEDTSSTEVKMPKSRSTLDFLGVPRKHQRSSSNSQPTNDFDALFSKENKPQTSSQRSVAIANLRHRRSHSSSDKWVEHKPVGNLELNTVLQPKMKKRKSVSKLKVKDVTAKDASKYLLEHQEQDSQGELETHMYKGDIIPSASGGAQVVFNDVEKLRQESPPAVQYNFRKRSSDGLPLSEIQDRCAVSIECQGFPSKIMKKK